MSARALNQFNDGNVKGKFGIWRGVSNIRIESRLSHRVGGLCVGGTGKWQGFPLCSSKELAPNNRVSRLYLLAHGCNNVYPCACGGSRDLGVFPVHGGPQEDIRRFLKGEWRRRASL